MLATGSRILSNRLASTMHSLPLPPPLRHLARPSSTLTMYYSVCSRSHDPASLITQYSHVRTSTSRHTPSRAWSSACARTHTRTHTLVASTSSTSQEHGPTMHSMQSPESKSATLAVPAPSSQPATKQRQQRKTQKPQRCPNDVKDHHHARPQLEPLPALLLEDDAHPIRNHHISAAAWSVLSRLHAANHLAYVVGGAVRDVLLGKTPKDFDVLTTAEPEEVVGLFPHRRAFVVGKSFPVCLVHEGGSVIEVSSFSTNADRSLIPCSSPMSGGKVASWNGRRGGDGGGEAPAGTTVMKKKGGKKKKGKRLDDGDGSGSASTDDGGQYTVAGTAGIDSNGSDGVAWLTPELNRQRKRELPSKLKSEVSASSDEEQDVTDVELDDSDDMVTALREKLVKTGPTWAAARRDNALRRDFTVNALQYDPSHRILYDYAGGCEDCRQGVLRALGDPEQSFRQDPARILRAIRLAARSGLDIDPLTAAAMHRLSPLVTLLPQGRLQFEAAAMMTHGAAAPSLRLLWRFGLLDLLFPHHALMLLGDKVPRLEAGTEAPLSSHLECSATPLIPQSTRRKSGLRKSSSSSSITNTTNGAVTTSKSKQDHLVFRFLDALDAAVSTQQPADTSAWVAVLAAPLILSEMRNVTERSVRKRKGKAGKAAKIASASTANDENVERSMEHEDLESSKVAVGGNMLMGHLDDSTLSTGFDLDALGLVDVGTLAASSVADDLLVSESSPSAYKIVVETVMQQLLNVPDSKGQRLLARDAAKRRKTGTEIQISATGADVACVLPRQAVQQAGEILARAFDIHSNDIVGKKRRKRRRFQGLNAAEDVVLRVLSKVEWGALVRLHGRI